VFENNFVGLSKYNFAGTLKISKTFDIPAISLSILYNYFDSSTKLLF